MKHWGIKKQQTIAHNGRNPSLVCGKLPFLGAALEESERHTQGELDMSKTNIKLTKVVIANILKQLSEGVSLRKACESHKVSSGSFCDLMVKDAELAEQYARAREAGADVQFDLMDDLEQDVLDGLLDPQAFRVAMDARKWRLGRMSPKKYGEKSCVDHNVAGELTFTWQK